MAINISSPKAIIALIVGAVMVLFAIGYFLLQSTVRLVDSNPADKDTDVPTRQFVFTARFNRDLDPKATVAASSIEPAVKGKFSVDKNIVTFRVDEALVPLERYKVTIGATSLFPTTKKSVVINFRASIIGPIPDDTSDLGD